MLGRNVGKGLRFHPVATASQLPLTPRVNETTVNDGDFPLRPSQSYKLKILRTSFAALLPSLLTTCYCLNIHSRR